MLWWTGHVEPALLMLVVERLVKPFLKQPGNDPKIIATANTELDRFLPILEKHLEGREYVIDKLTIADFAMAPWFESAQHLEVPMERYRNIGRWLERMHAKPYWASA
jgi:GST-like protein